MLNKKLNPAILNQYMNKFVTASEAVKVIKSNDRIYIRSNSAYPEILVNAMVERKNELRNVEICHLMVLGDAPYMKEEMDGCFRHNGFFLGANTRKHVNAGRA